MDNFYFSEQLQKNIHIKCVLFLCHWNSKVRFIIENCVCRNAARKLFWTSLATFLFTELHQNKEEGCIYQLQGHYLFRRAGHFLHAYMVIQDGPRLCQNNLRNLKSIKQNWEIIFSLYIYALVIFCIKCVCMINHKVSP